MSDTHRLPNGLVFAVRPDTSDVNSAISCAWEDAYEIGKFDIAGKPVFDIGSHVGGVAMLAAFLGAWPVVAVEPVPENAALIRETAVLNNLHAVNVIEAAAGTDTVVYGWYGEGAYGEVTAEVHRFVGNSSYSESGYEHANEVHVQTVTLAELIERFGAPALIKLDCEGGEWSILEEPCSRDVPVIVGEYHYWRGVPPMVGVVDGGPGNKDNRAEITRLLGETHNLSFHGPSGPDAGNFLAVKK